MEDSLRVYRTMLRFVWDNGVRFHDLRCLATFVWMVTGLLMSHIVHLGRWAAHRKGAGKAASKERQFSRWLHNLKIEPMKVYRPMIAKALMELQEQCLYLALDSSVLWERFVVVRLALIYRGRALPLSWAVVVSQSAMVAFESYRRVLDEAVQLFPEGSKVVLLADRGFDDQKLFSYLGELGWYFRIRLKSSFWVYRASQPRQKVGQLMPARGGALFLHKVWIGDHRFGPVYLALAHVQTPNGYEEWAIVSDEPTDVHTFDEFGLRFDIEEGFLDDKSAGFQLEASEIRSTDALARLMLILATTTLYLVSTGVAIVAMGQRCLVDAHWQRGLSYFHIGWRWIEHALAHGKRLLPFLWLEPGLDPQPVCASKKQSAEPITILYSLCLEVT